MKAKEIYMYALGGLITLGFFAVLAVLIVSGKYPEAVNLVIGTLLTTFGTVVGYFFGSSKGSADKTAMLANSTPNPQP
jgi:hypothetical protein